MTAANAAEIWQEASPEDLATLSGWLAPRWWATHTAKLVLPKQGRLRFEDHPFLEALYDDLNPLIVVIKGAQLGFSSWAISRSLWAVSEFPLSVLYGFPTKTDVTEFTQARINPLIRSSAHLSDRVLDVESVYLKQFSRFGRKAVLEARKRGTVVPEMARVGTIYFGGSQTERDAQSKDVDILIHDEEDRSAPAVIDLLGERLSGSRLQWRYRISTPTFPGAGVDRAYRSSDQREWMHTCSRCNATFAMGFPKGEGDPKGCIWPEAWDPVWGEEWRPDVEATYVCPLCREPLREEDRATGEWVAAYPDRVVHGYHVTQMSAPWIPASSILHKKFKARWEGHFWNLVMGVPYQDQAEALTRAAILERADQVREKQVSSEVPTCIGIDPGAKFDVTVDITEATGPRTIWMGTVDSWGELDQLLLRYHAASVVIDAQPEEHATKDWAAKYPDRVWRCYYGGTREVVWKADDRTVTCPRTLILTRSADELLSARRLPKYDGSDGWERYLEHHVNSKKVPIWVEGLEHERVVDHYEWIETGPDHQFHSATYAMLARDAYRPTGLPTRGLVSLRRGRTAPTERLEPYRTRAHRG